MYLISYFLRYFVHIRTFSEYIQQVTGMIGALSFQNKLEALMTKMQLSSNSSPAVAKHLHHSATSELLLFGCGMGTAEATATISETNTLAASETI